MVDTSFESFPFVGLNLGPSYVLPPPTPEQVTIGLAILGIAAAALIGLGIYVVEFQPKALPATYKPAPDQVLGWTGDLHFN